MEDVKRYKGRERAQRQETDKKRTGNEVDISLSDGCWGGHLALTIYPDGHSQNQ